MGSDAEQPIEWASIEQSDPPRPPRETLPTMYDLPAEDLQEPGLPDEFHDLQPQLLSRTLRLQDYSRDNYFTASDLNLYYSVKHPLWHKRPDWFLAIDVPRLYEGNDLRRSFVTWQEGQSPYVVVEFLSPGTEVEDLGRFYDDASKVFDSGTTAAIPDEPAGNGVRSGKPKPPRKFDVYEHYLRVPYYIVYSRYTQRLRYFKLEGGQYQEQPLSNQEQPLCAVTPLIWLEDLKIGLSLWEGEYEGISSCWLRWCDHSGAWWLTDTEQEQLAKEQAQMEKEQVQAQLLQAAQNLLESGMTIAQVTQLLNLSDSQLSSLRLQEAIE